MSFYSNKLITLQQCEVAINKLKELETKGKGLSNEETQYVLEAQQLVEYITFTETNPLWSVEDMDDNSEIDDTFVYKIKTSINLDTFKTIVDNMLSKLSVDCTDPNTSCKIVDDMLYMTISDGNKFKALELLHNIEFYGDLLQDIGTVEEESKTNMVDYLNKLKDYQELCGYVRSFPKEWYSKSLKRVLYLSLLFTTKTIELTK